jgi:hypothetical protein
VNRVADDAIAITSSFPAICGLVSQFAILYVSKFCIAHDAVLFIDSENPTDKGEKTDDAGKAAAPTQADFMSVLKQMMTKSVEMKAQKAAQNQMPFFGQSASSEYPPFSTSKEREERKEQEKEKEKPEGKAAEKGSASELLHFITQVVDQVGWMGLASLFFCLVQ